MPDPKYLKAVATASQKYGVPAELLAAQIQGESNWNPDAKSPAGATGISQFMPGTAKGYGIDPKDPMQSIDAQGKMMSSLLKSYGGDQRLALAAYNAGAGNVKNGKVPAIPETQNYVKNVLSYEKNYPGLKAGKWNNPGIPTKSGVPSTASTTPSNGTSQVTDLVDHDNAATAHRASQLPLISSLLNRPGVHNPGLDMLAQFQAAGQSTAALTGAAPANAPGVDINISPKAKQQGTNPSALAAKVAGPQAAKIVQLAQQYLGTPYKWGGSDPQNGFDCSGFVKYLYDKQGINLPRTTFEQVKSGVAVDRKELQPGDILFFNTAGANTHEGMYIGNNKFIQAPHTGDVVKISDLADPYYAKHYSTARRVTGGVNAK